MDREDLVFPRRKPVSSSNKPREGCREKGGMGRGGSLGRRERGTGLVPEGDRAGEEGLVTDIGLMSEGGRK